MIPFGMPAQDASSLADARPAATPTAAEATATRQGFLAAGVVVLCWSGFNIVSRIGGRSVLTPFDLAALRFMVAGVLLSPLFIASLRNGHTLHWTRRALLALSGGLGYALFAYVGFSLAPAAHAGVLVNGGIPLATTLIGWLAFGLQPTRRAWMALAIAALGIVLIGHHGFQLRDAAGTLRGDLCYLLAACCWGLYGQLIRRWQIPPLTAAANVAVCSAVLYLPVYGLWLPKGLALATHAQILLQAGYQGIVAGVIAAIGYTFATLRIGPTRASLMLALVPPISAVAAVPLLGETLTAEILAGALLVTCGALIGASGGTGIRRAPGSR